jgi:hypothetical protein
MRESSRAIPFLLSAAEAAARRGAQESSGIRTIMDLGEAHKPERITFRRQCLFCPRFLDNFKLSQQPESGSLMRGWHFAADEPGHCRKQNANGYSSHQLHALRARECRVSHSGQRWPSGPRLIEHRLKRARIDSEQNLTLSDEASSLILLANQIAAHLGLNLRVHVPLERSYPHPSSGTSF